TEVPGRRSLACASEIVRRSVPVGTDPSIVARIERRPRARSVRAIVRKARSRWRLDSVILVRIWGGSMVQMYSGDLHILVTLHSLDIFPARRQTDQPVIWKGSARKGLNVSPHFV